MVGGFYLAAWGPRTAAVGLTRAGAGGGRPGWPSWRVSLRAVRRGCVACRRYRSAVAGSANRPRQSRGSACRRLKPSRPPQHVADGLAAACSVGVSARFGLSPTAVVPFGVERRWRFTWRRVGERARPAGVIVAGASIRAARRGGVPAGKPRSPCCGGAVHGGRRTILGACRRFFMTPAPRTRSFRRHRRCYDVQIPSPRHA